MNDTEAERVLACPVCGEALQIDAKSGVSIDVCPEHGIWLDAGELDAIVKKIRAQHLRMKSRQVREARRSGKVSGALWGWWSLLGD